MYHSVFFLTTFPNSCIPMLIDLYFPNQYWQGMVSRSSTAWRGFCSICMYIVYLHGVDVPICNLIIHFYSTNTSLHYLPLSPHDFCPWYLTTPRGPSLRDDTLHPAETGWMVGSIRYIIQSRSPPDPTSRLSWAQGWISRKLCLSLNIDRVDSSPILGQSCCWDCRLQSQLLTWVLSRTPA